jgi:hypothetical protein
MCLLFDVLPSNGCCVLVARSFPRNWSTRRIIDYLTVLSATLLIILHCIHLKQVFMLEREKGHVF